MRVIGKIWQVSKGVNIESVSGNTFAFHFGDEYDLNRVIAGSPWSFDNALIALERPVGKGTIDNLCFSQVEFWVQIHQTPLLCMNMEIGGFLGGLVGQVLDVNGGRSGDCVGKFLRVRIRIDIMRPLRRCLCGMVNHTTKECTDVEPIPITNGKEDPLSGAWLRASEQTMMHSTVGEAEFSKTDSAIRKEGVIPEQAEMTANLVETKSPQSAINNEMMVEVADELDFFGPLEKQCGPLPSLLVLQPSSDMGSEKATAEPNESVYNLHSVLGSTKSGSCSGSNSNLDTSSISSLLSNRIRRSNFRAKRPNSISAADSKISTHCGKRKEKVVQIVDKDRIKKARTAIYISVSPR
ncbi:hypothetical protein EZV62_006507 [Acer yangbiense]|uniref:DUF4283 domain-containing protein n=1 Tax=Acer yangbiense TaxID=1000413 RepID=A0A5C7I9A4_9ROSI|nr:hypothetical protein EZV62_006507 [Acer yangbiense]